MKTRLKPDTIKEISLLMAPSSKESPFYLNGDELVDFFNRIGSNDQFIWEEGKGICTKDIGEGLSRLNYVQGRLMSYNKKGEVLSVFTRFTSIFGDKTSLLMGLNVILNKFGVNVYSKLSKTNTMELVNHTGKVNKKPMVIFISYSHDDNSHKDWVRQLADDLKDAGFEVLLDQYNLSGTSLTLFMNNGIQKADKVLVIGTPEYSKKSKQQSGGAAYEGAIMSVTLLNNLSSTKFVPVLRKGTFATSFPILIGDRIGFDFSNDVDYNERVREMINKFNEESNQ